jgi:hypothetical protein
MLAVRAELVAGQQIVLNRLLQAKCSKPFVRAGNTAVVAQPCIASSTPMQQLVSSAVKAAAAEEQKTNNVDSLEAERAKRRLDFEAVPEAVPEPVPEPEEKEVQPAKDDAVFSKDAAEDDESAKKEDVLTGKRSGLPDSKDFPPKIQKL